uniref:TPK_B1_binding domain-containing protein n=1 Tax=Mesocestoides corti TaxID=53468 RepID=A0A5K3F282_MESCO
MELVDGLPSTMATSKLVLFTGREKGKFGCCLEDIFSTEGVALVGSGRGLTDATLKGWLDPWGTDPRYPNVKRLESFDGSLGLPEKVEFEDEKPGAVAACILWRR